jgi:hypothetical protein
LQNIAPDGALGGLPPPRRGRLGNLIKVLSETVLILVGGTAVLAILLGIRLDCFAALVKVETLESA